MEKMTLEEKIGHMLCFAFHGTEYNLQLKTLIEDYKISNVILFARNIINNNQVLELNRSIVEKSSQKVFIGLDQEGGMVRRITEEITYLPGAMALSASDRKQIRTITKEANQDLKHLGFNFNFAPNVDVNNNPYNPVINSRSYSDDASVVTTLGFQALKGMQDSKMLGTYKHFPGHGDTSVDSHVGYPVVNKSIDEITNIELKPYIDAINQGLEAIMISHVLYPQIDSSYPSSLSYNIITKLLKEKLGFKGLVITDSLTMQAIYSKYNIEEIILNAVNAGNDILMFCGEATLTMQEAIIHKFIELVQKGKISLERIDESVSKILSLKNKYSVDFSQQLINNCQLSEEIVKKSITKVFSNEKLFPINPKDQVLIIFPKIHLTTLVDNANNKYETLKKYIKCQEIITYEQEDYEFLINEQQKYNKIILATYNVQKNDYQTKIYNYLDKKKTIVVALRSPYDIYYLPECENYLCTYDFTKESIKQLAFCLIDNCFEGKLPVKIKRR